MKCFLCHKPTNDWMEFIMRMDYNSSVMLGHVCKSCVPRATSKFKPGPPEATCTACGSPPEYNGLCKPHYIKSLIHSTDSNKKYFKSLLSSNEPDLGETIRNVQNKIKINEDKLRKVAGEEILTGDLPEYKFTAVCDLCGVTMNHWYDAWAWDIDFANQIDLGRTCESCKKDLWDWFWGGHREE